MRLSPRKTPFSLIFLFRIAWHTFGYSYIRRTCLFVAVQHHHNLFFIWCNPNCSILTREERKTWLRLLNHTITIARSATTKAHTTQSPIHLSDIQYISIWRNAECRLYTQHYIIVIIAIDLDSRVVWSGVWVCACARSPIFCQNEVNNDDNVTFRNSQSITHFWSRSIWRYSYEHAYATAGMRAWSLSVYIICTRV